MTGRDEGTDGTGAAGDDTTGRGAGGGADLEEEARVAWGDFALELAMHLGHEGSPVVMQAVTDEHAVTPYVQCVCDDGRVTVEVVSNHYLPRGRRWTPAQKRQIRALGFERPCTVREFANGEFRTANYRACFAHGAVEEAALLAVRALTDVLGVAHPALLDAGDLTLPAPGPVSTDPVELEPQVAQSVDGPEDLTVLVGMVLEARLRQRLIQDRDETWLLATGDLVVALRVWEEAPFVEMSCRLREDLRSPTVGLRLAAMLNERAVVERYVVEDGALVGRLVFLARPFVPEHLTELLGGFGRQMNAVHRRLNGGEPGRDWPRSA